MWIIAVLFVLVTFTFLGYVSAPIWGWAVGLVLLSVVFKSTLLLILSLLLCALLGIPAWRKRLITKPAFSVFKKVLPTLSETERTAIDAGTVWWDGELFNGKPDWDKLAALPAPTLTAEEQAFIDGPVEELCQMLNDWDIVHHQHDLTPEQWQFIREHKFFAMIIKKQYGGLEFSNYAHAKVVSKITTRCATAATMVMVPNSLGPGELLQHYGTKAQCDYYLPRLAAGIDIPCFALTSPYAGSDAGAIPDTGVVCRGDYTDPRDGKSYQDVLGIRVSFEKRWMTLGPIATVFGLAFQLHDPDHLLGEKEHIGITCALLPKGTKGLHNERRHYPNNTPFQNGPIWGEDVFIPLEWIIGGPEYAGQGWRMLMECLSVGRSISLPALSVASGKLSSYTSAAWAGIRHQFGLPIGKFEGVDEALARIGGNTYQMEAAQNLALTGLDLGEKPSVISAILKYHNTERMRKVVNDAMDIHGGRAVVIGPRNYLASAYNAIPVAITVEGANILTRSMMIFGQGAFRCHRYVLGEIKAAAENDLDAFDAALCGHIRQISRNKTRAFVMGFSNGRGSPVPANAGELTVYYQRLNRLSAAFSYTSDLMMATLGGSLKFREKLSGRLADAFSNLYIASAVLKHWQAQGAHADDLPLAQYAAEQALHDGELALDQLRHNLPQRWLRLALKWVIFPLGRRNPPPSDALGTKLARTMMDFGEPLKRLTQYFYIPTQASPQEIKEPIAALEATLAAIRATHEAEKTIRKAERDGTLHALTPQDRVAEAVQLGLISQQAHDEILAARKLMRIAITVDDFDMQLEKYNDALFERIIYLAK